jgi:hypothetical protein
MPKSVTVKFEDGTNHTYDNVPDNIDDETVRDRAANEYSDRKVVNVVEGTKPKTKSAEQEPSLGAKIGSGLQTGYETVKDIATSPLGELAVGGYGVKKVLLNPILDALKTRGAAGPVAPGPQIQVPTNACGVPRPAGNMGTAQQTFNALRTPPPAAPAVAPMAEAQPSMIQKGMQYANQMRQLAAQQAMKMAPAASAAAIPVAIGAAVAAPGVAMMAHDYNLYRQLTPEQKRQQAMLALSGQANGQAGM